MTPLLTSHRENQFTSFVAKNIPVQLELIIERSRPADNQRKDCELEIHVHVPSSVTFHDHIAKEKNYLRNGKRHSVYY